MKRLLSAALSIVFILICCVPLASAATGGVASPMASPTICSTMAYAHPGDKPGEFCIEFRVMAVDTASSLGASSIVIHKPDGSTYTVLGSVGNRLIGSGTDHVGTYVYHGVSGQSYYAEVTLFATIGSKTDSRLVLTASEDAR